ncbi:MAG TPA: hypothetical protein VF628_05630 [Allosphingosinicella sp.]|jgi:hypothetical protein
MSDQPQTPEQQRPEEKQAEVATDASAAKRKKQLVTAGVAAGIGSAAIVAALLYAKSTRRTQD